MIVKAHHKLLMLFVMIPLALLLVNSMMAMQLLIRYQAMITMEIETLRTPQNEQQLTELTESSQAMANQAKMMLVVMVMISTLLCVMTGFLVSKQFIGSSANFSDRLVQGELTIIRNKLDELIAMLNRQDVQ